MHANPFKAQLDQLTFLTEEALNEMIATRISNNMPNEDIKAFHDKAITKIGKAGLVFLWLVTVIL